METLTLEEGGGTYNQPFGWRGELDLKTGQNLSVRVEVDDLDYGDNGPRDWDNLGTMVCWHRHYHLGDIQPKTSPEDFRRELAQMVDPTTEDRIEFWEYGDGCYRRDAEDRIQSIIGRVIDKEIAVLLPLYLYDHSGITISTGPFSCPWDSGQVGYIYVTKEQLRDEYSVKRITKKTLDRAEKVLRGEVETYDDYLTGNVWGYSIEITSTETCQECNRTDHPVDFEDSCWGFYGDPRGYMLSEINAILEKFRVEVEF